MNEALVDAIAGQRQDFTSLAESVANYMQQTLEAVRDGFSTVRSEISELRTEMDTGFTAAYAKFDQIDGEIRDIKDQLAS